MTAPAAIVLGHAARRGIARPGQAGAGLATAALILGYIITARWVVSCGWFIVRAAHNGAPR